MLTDSVQRLYSTGLPGRFVTSRRVLPGVESHQWARGCYALTRSTSAVIGDQFDIAALIQDYAEWLPEAPEAARQIAEALTAAGGRQLRDFLNFRDVGCAMTPAELARSGLLLGYPVETTVALIRQDLGLSGGVS